MDMEMDMGTDMETDMETDTEMSQWTKVGRGHVGARCTRWRARGHLSARRPLRVARGRGGGTRAWAASSAARAVCSSSERSRCGARAQL